MHPHTQCTTGTSLTLQLQLTENQLRQLSAPGHPGNQVLTYHQLAVPVPHAMISCRMLYDNQDADRKAFVSWLSFNKYEGNWKVSDGAQQVS